MLLLPLFDLPPPTTSVGQDEEKGSASQHLIGFTICWAFSLSVPDTYEDQAKLEYRQ